VFLEELKVENFSIRVFIGVLSHNAREVDSALLLCEWLVKNIVPR
jgi:hypothetical protein